MADVRALRRRGAVKVVPSYCKLPVGEVFVGLFTGSPGNVRQMRSGDGIKTWLFVDHSGLRGWEVPACYQLDQELPPLAGRVVFLKALPKQPGGRGQNGVSNYQIADMGDPSDWPDLDGVRVQGVLDPVTAEELEEALWGTIPPEREDSAA